MEIAMSFLTPYLAWIKVIAVLAVLIALWLWGYHVADVHWQLKYDAAQSAVQAQVIIEQQKNAKLIQDQEATSAAIEASYEQKLQSADIASGALRALIVQYREALRAGAMSPLPHSTAGTNPAPEKPGSDAGIDSAVGVAIGACNSDAVQLQALIEWNAQTAKLWMQGK